MIEEIRKLLPKRPKDSPSIIMKSSLVQKALKRDIREETFEEETVKKPHLEACLPTQGIFVAT